MAADSISKRFTASDAAQALNRIMNGDQGAMLEVLEDFFYEPDDERIVKKRKAERLEMTSQDPEGLVQETGVYYCTVIA